jgi:tRNA A-37 threonylcarbamoyl transferase component Bud32
MADDTQPFVASAEDYFSDNTRGRDERRYARQTGAPLGVVKARRRPRGAKRQGSFKDCLVQVATRLSQGEFDAQLDRLNIPRPNDPLDMPPILRDGMFPFIGQLLRQFGQGEWALRPRTFCILRILGRPELMDSFVAMKRTDAFLPYSDRNLPDAIRGADIRAKFLRLQELVLSGQNLKDLENEGGAHFSFHTPADDYFSPIAHLGQGLTGKVDHVWGSFSLKHFARKRIYRGRSVLRDQVALSTFLNELSILKAASHRHLVKLVSSYTDPTYVGIIMTPVADEDLKSYLKRQPKGDVERNARKQCIRTFFGCLTKALEYLHYHRIHHKDIKPANVLVKNTDIFLTDFGTAKAHTETSRSTSTGQVLQWTPRYGAPEIANQDVRIYLSPFEHSTNTP